MISPLNAQNIDEKVNTTLKPLVLIGDRVVVFGKYCNNRFDYCVAYPEKIFETELEPTNDDGRIWVSEDGDMHLTVYGVNSLDWSLQNEYHRWREVLRANSEGEELNLKTSILADNYFELAGVVNGEYYYQKTYLNQDKEQFITLIFRSEMDPIENKQLRELQETITESFMLQSMP
ncbi:MAG: hypothetical protein R3E32_00335 [Chitinophagales bacterium]